MQGTRYSCHVLMKLRFSGQFFEKKKLEYQISSNPSGGSRIVLCGRTDGRTDITKLIVAFRNFVNAPKNKAFAATTL